MLARIHGGNFYTLLIVLIIKQRSLALIDTSSTFAATGPLSEALDLSLWEPISLDA
jgi:hypothetical protein